MDRPSILLIQSDQHRWDCLGLSDHPLLRTPHLDRLGREGTVFSHAFTPIAVCVPARNSLLYGVWPTTHLAIANHGTEAPRPARDGLTAFTSILRQQGYRLSHVGKWQIHPQKPPTDFAFDEAVSGRDYPEWRRCQGLSAMPRKNGWFGECDTGVEPRQSRPAWGADRTIECLRRAAANSAPFFLQWDLDEPHLPNVVPEPYCSMYPPESVEPWPGFPDPLAGKPFIQRQQRRTWGVDGWTWDRWAPIVARYLGEISLIDAQIGRVLHCLDELGLTDNTLVVYTTDHGDLCGSHGMVDKHLVMYDDLVRVPLLMRWPAAGSAGMRCDAFVCHALDLAATFCAAAGTPPPAAYHGLSLLPALQGHSPNQRPDIFAMYHGNQFGLYSQRMVRARQWKYVWNATAEDELYNLAADPGELVNLASDPTAHPRLSRMRARLVDWMSDIGDPLLNGWTRAQLLDGCKTND